MEVSLIKKAETNRAILVTEDNKTEVWLPKSQIDWEDQKDGSIIVYMPEWLYEEKGFIS